MSEITAGSGSLGEELLEAAHLHYLGFIAQSKVYEGELVWTSA